MAESTRSIFELPEFKAYQGRFTQRANTFGQYRRYASGKIYDDSNFKLAHKLYAQTKSLLSFLARAVDLDIALVPGVMQPWALAEGTPTKLVDAQKTLYEWSSWDTEGDEWLEDGTTCGEAFLKIVPDEVARQVRMQRLRPELCLLTKHVDPETATTVDLALIIDRGMTDSEGKSYEYAEAITPTVVRTYWNGEPHGYHGNPDRYDNPLGFVPVVRVKNDSECRPTFAKTLPQLDSVNELASYLANVIGRHVEPQWMASGVEQSDLVKDGKNVWFAPHPDAKLQAILADIDVEGTLAFITELKQETKSNLPELAFDDLRAKDQIAAETLEIQLIELDAKIWKMRRRYDAALVDAHKMSAMAATVYGMGELATLLAPHNFDWKRPTRPVSRLEQIREQEAELNLALLQSATSSEGMTKLLTPGGQGAVPELATTTSQEA
jgi:hypothetical protein